MFCILSAMASSGCCTPLRFGALATMPCISMTDEYSAALDLVALHLVRFYMFCTLSAVISAKHALNS